MLLSEGGVYTPPPPDVLRLRGESFVKRVRLGYVVVERARASPALVQYAVTAFALERLGGDAAFDLYRTAVPVDLDRPAGELPPILQARGVTTAVALPTR